MIVNDLIQPFKKDVKNKDLVKYATIITIIIGVFSAVAGIYASSILQLFSKAYAMAGGGLVPLLIVGLLWKERADEAFEMGKRNSNVTPWGARIGIITGSVMTQISAIGENRILIALVVSAIFIVSISNITINREKTLEKV